MRLPIRYQMLIPFAGTMLLVLVVVSALNAYFAARHVAQHIERQLHEMAVTLRGASFPLTDSVLSQVRGLSGAEFVLTGRDGRVLAASRESFSAIDSARLREAPRELGSEPGIALAGEMYFHAAVDVPEVAARQHAATLHILYPERVWREARWQAAWPPLAVGGVALAVVTMLALALAGRLSRPIRNLRSHVGRVAGGDFRPLPLPARDDELRDLAASINTMAGQLDELGQAMRRAERLALVGQLSGGLVHHLRNSITGARMAVQLHQRQCPAPDRESLEVALRQLALTEERLQRFLAIGAPREPRRTSFDAREALAEVATLIEPTCRHRKVALRVDCPDEPVELLADLELVRQLLLNLSLNAVEAAGSGGWVQWNVARRDETTVRLSVRDSGPGPPPELRERLFEPFVTGRPEGIGLGLAVVRQIAAAHGGSVRYTADETTCFEVELPAAVAADSSRAPDEPLTAASADPGASIR